MTAADADADLARLGLRLADELERRLGVVSAGVVRALARRVQLGPTPRPDGCAGCGAPLEHPPTGRPRKWCSERCRRRARR